MKPETARQAQEIARTIIDRYRYGNCTDEEYSVATPQNQAVWIVREMSEAGLIADRPAEPLEKFEELPAAGQEGD